MVESSSQTPPVRASRQGSLWTRRRLGIGAVALLLLGTALLSSGVGSPGSASQPPRATAAPLAAAEPPLAPRSGLAAPPPAAWSRQPGSAVGFAGTPDRSAVARGGDGLMRVELVMKADEVAAGARSESDFVVVLDRSGSMAGERLLRAQQAISALIEQLSPRDRFGLVVYDDEAEVKIPLGFAEPTTKLAWRLKLATIWSGGSTNLSEGLDRGLALLTEGSRRRAGRVLLLSDGHANAGDTSPEGLRARGRRATERELTLSTVGIGAGFNEFLMSQLADAGTGNFHYLDEKSALASIFEKELSSARATVARSLRVRITPAEGVSVVDAAGYPLQTDSEGTTFQVGSLFSGQERRVWLTLRVPSDREAEHRLGGIRLEYVEADAPRHLELPALSVRAVEDEKIALASIDKGAWERAVVQDEWGRVQQEVARAVHEGRREQAAAAIRDYETKQKAINAVVGSAAVTGALLEADALERQVEDAFAGGDQSAKQNALSKRNLASGLNSRRVGSIFDSSSY